MKSLLPDPTDTQLYCMVCLFLLQL